MTHKLSQLHDVNAIALQHKAHEFDRTSTQKPISSLFYSGARSHFHTKASKLVVLLR
jgi:hypothetical protein